MKVLIITYYWPPSGGSGVQRWLKFVKYLQDFGVEPIVYTVDNPDFPVKDNSLEKDIPNSVKIIKQPIWEPYKIVNFFSKNKSSKKSIGLIKQHPSFFGRLAMYIRINFLIPDARVFWIKPSVNYLNQYLKENPVDAIITTGPPHSVHLIGLRLKKLHSIKWIADFRDLWTAAGYFDDLPVTKRTQRIHEKLKQHVFANSDTLLVVGNCMKKIYAPFHHNIHVITNGYDSKKDKASIRLDTKFSIAHIGLMNKDQNPLVLWKALSELMLENQNFSNDLEIQLIGNVAEEVLTSLSEHHVNSHCKQISYLSHDEVSHYQQKAQVLLIAINNVENAKVIITGKVFEYLDAKRPILAIGPTDGDLASIINETTSGEIIDFDDIKKLKQVIMNMYTKYLDEKLVSTTCNIEKYHRKNLTAQLVQVIQSTVKK